MVVAGRGEGGRRKKRGDVGWGIRCGGGRALVELGNQLEALGGCGSVVVGESGPQWQRWGWTSEGLVGAVVRGRWARAVGCGKRRGGGARTLGRPQGREGQRRGGGYLLGGQGRGRGIAARGGGRPLTGNKKKKAHARKRVLLCGPGPPRGLCPGGPIKVP